MKKKERRVADGIVAFENENGKRWRKWAWAMGRRERKEKPEEWSVSDAFSILHTVFQAQALEKRSASARMEWA